MTGADAADRAPYDLVGILSVASAALDSGGHYASFAADHLVMAYPIKSSDERVCTLAVAWSTAALPAQMRLVLLSGVVLVLGVVVVLVRLLPWDLSRRHQHPPAHTNGH